VPLADMTSFHTFGTHLYQGNVSYFLDGTLLTSAPAITSGLTNFLLLGDGSATDVSGYGSLRVDSLSITVNAGAPVPEPADVAVWLAGAVLAGTVISKSRCHQIRSDH
jgi:hypothetical protein